MHAEAELPVVHIGDVSCAADGKWVNVVVNLAGKLHCSLEYITSRPM